MDDELDWNDGYFDAQMGALPRSMSGDYYMGFLAYQDELSFERDDINDKIGEIRDSMYDDIESGDFDSARDSLDEIKDLEDRIDEIDSEMY